MSGFYEFFCLGLYLWRNCDFSFFLLILFDVGRSFLPWDRGGGFVLYGSEKWKSAAKDKLGISVFGSVISVWDWCFRG